MKTILVKTERLCMVPRTLEELRILHRDELDSEMKKAYQDMLDTMLRLPGLEEWGTNWKISLRTGEVVGGIGFKGAPDANGVVEIGYGIEEDYQRQGYATEAVKGMAHWALTQSGVRCVTAQTEEDNAISQKVLLGNGFIRAGYGEEGPLFHKTL